jgi:hypothetical protein
VACYRENLYLYVTKHSRFTPFILSLSPPVSVLVPQTEIDFLLMIKAKDLFLAGRQEFDFGQRK